MSALLPATPDDREFERVRAQASLTRCDERAADSARFGSRDAQQADYAANVASLHREMAADFH